MPPRFKKIDMSNNYMAMFVDQIPNLVAQFIQADLDAQRRAQEIKLKEEWYEKEKQDRKEQFALESKLKSQISWRDTLYGIYEDKINTLNTKVASLEEQGMKVDGLRPLEKTKAYQSLLEVQSTDPIEDVKEQANIINGLIQDTQNQIVSSQNRLDFVIDLNSEMNKRSHYYTKGEKTREEIITGKDLWSVNDYEIMMTEILQDPIFIQSQLKKGHIDKDGVWAPYVVDFTDRMKAPDYSKLMKLNTQLIEYEQLLTSDSLNNMKNTITKLSYEMALDETSVLAEQITNQMKSMDNLSKGLMGLPSFRDAFSMTLTSYEKYRDSLKNIDYLVKTDDDVAFYLKEAKAIGYMPEGGDESNWDVTTTKDFLKWKARTVFNKSSGIAMLLSPSDLDYVFGEEQLSEVSFLYALTTGIEKYNRYLDVDGVVKSGNEVSKEDRAFHRKFSQDIMGSIGMGVISMKQDASIDVSDLNLGYSTLNVSKIMRDPVLLQQVLRRNDGRLSQYINEYTSTSEYQNIISNLNNSIIDLLGSDGEMMDAELFRIRDNFESNEIKYKGLINSLPASFQNYKDTMSAIPTTGTRLKDNNINTELANATSCGEGQVYQDAIGACVTDFSSTELSGVIDPYQYVTHQFFSEAEGSEGVWETAKKGFLLYNTQGRLGKQQ